jgi:hypothetical protein
MLVKIFGTEIKRKREIPVLFSSPTSAFDFFTGDE